MKEKISGKVKPNHMLEGVAMFYNRLKKFGESAGELQQ